MATCNTKSGVFVCVCARFSSGRYKKHDGEGAGCRGLLSVSGQIQKVVVHGRSQLRCP